MTTPESSPSSAWMAEVMGKLGKHTLTYTVGVLLYRMTSVLMLPVYTRFLRPADYGVLELLTTTVDVVSIVAGAGLAQTVIRFYSTCETDEERHSLFSTAMVTLLTLAGVFAGLGILFAPQLAQLVYGDTAYTFHFRLAFSTLAVQAGIELPMVWFQVQQRSMIRVGLGLSRLVLQLSLNIWFVAFAGFGVVGVLFSSLIGSAALAAVCLAYMVRTVGLSFSKERAVGLLKFGGPIIFWTLSAFVLTFSDRFYLNRYGSLQQVGLYALAYKFGFILSAFASGPFSQVWDPLRFEILKRPDGKETVQKVFGYFNIGLLAIALGMAVFADPLLVAVAAPEYRAAVSLVPPILLAYVLQSWTAFTNVGLFMVGRTTTYAVWGLVAAISVTVFNLALIPSFGAQGAAWAAVLAFLVRFLGVYYSSQRAYPLPYDWSRLSLLISAVALLGVAASMSSHVAGLVVSIGIGIVALLIFAAVGYRFGLSSQERQIIPAVIRLAVGRSAAN